jgi:hypothetical protein
VAASKTGLGQEFPGLSLQDSDEAAGPDIRFILLALFRRQPVLGALIGQHVNSLSTGTLSSFPANLPESSNERLTALATSLT